MSGAKTTASGSAAKPPAAAPTKLPLPPAPLAVPTPSGSAIPPPAPPTASASTSAKPAAAPAPPKSGALPPPPPTLAAPTPTGTFIPAAPAPPLTPPSPSTSGAAPKPPATPATIPPPAASEPSSSASAAALKPPPPPATAPPPAASSSASGGTAASSSSASSAPSPMSSAPSTVMSAGMTAPPGPPPPAPAGQSDPHALTPARDNHITPEMERCIRRRPGFEYMYVWIDWPGNKKPLGIVLATRFHRVIVSALKPGSLGEEKLKVLDRFITVNGCPVSDKDVAKTIMVQAQGRFGAIVERPTNDEAKKEFEAKSILAPVPPPPTGGPPAPSIIGAVPPTGILAAAMANAAIPPLPGDVQALVERHVADRKAGVFKTTAPAPILKGKATSLRTDSKLALTVSPCESKEVLIPCDTDPNKKLRKVNGPKK